MIDRNQVRDRTLILRVLVPSLQVELRDKMAKREEEVMAAANEAAAKHAAKEAEMMAEQRSNPMAAMMMPPVPPAPTISKEGQVMDLEGVTCEPTENASTLWNFHCDGATYPARLVNLPCPVEVMKTQDHAIYHKCTDIAQLLIVYEDMMSLEEAESSSGYKVEGFPSYYHSGITPPMKRVVERRFQAREHKAVAPPKQEVMDVEQELQNLMDSISKDPSKVKGSNKGNKAKGAKNTTNNNTSSTNVNKIIEEIEEEIVDYEPWMDDYGRQPYGIEFDEKDVMCTKHPELWLDPHDETEATKAAEMAEAKKKEEKKEKKKKKSGSVDAPALPSNNDSKTNKQKSTNATTTNNNTNINDVTNTNTNKPESTKKEKSKKESKKEEGSKKKSKKKKNKEKQQQQQESNGPDRKKGIAAKKTRDEIDEVTKIATQIARMDNNDDEEQLLLEGDFFDFAGDDAFENLDF